MIKARILVVDDVVENREILQMRLESQGYAVATAIDGEDGLTKIASMAPDVVLLDVMMPKLDGFEVCRRLRANPAIPFVPIILLTALAETQNLVVGLDAGADDYLFKPIDHATLVARVRAMLRIKRLHDQVQQQARELVEWNTRLEARVAAQLEEIARVGKLKRFLAPQLAEMLVAQGDDSILRNHRRDIAVLFCDLRGFTAFAEQAEPEEVMTLLADFHAAVGPLIHAYEGTLDRFMGDGLMVFFNDPLPCPDAAHRAVRLAVSMREAVQVISDKWQRRGQPIGFGVGIAQGYATLGQIGFEGRNDYSAIGSTPNLAARLCGEAADGEILISSRVADAVGDIAELQATDAKTLKGFARPVPAWNVIAVR
ncbi:response regulator [Vineibacter terrae]|uniref:Response regulator n=1 Tax=Vineibacter terrae TaxID=2586908 RepID=A0A5C8PAP8_9HYPH|nr:response regulator [Vineibacter terrae]TXL70862.1 response regulator [Vineibacter terrae]